MSICSVACNLTHVPLCLAAPVTGLRFLSVSTNALQSLPAELMAQSLTSLSISHNPQLRLSSEDVDHLLARLPRLQDLNHYSTAISQPASLHVARVLRMRAD